MFQVNVSGADPVTVRFVGALTAGCREAVARVLHDAAWHAGSIVIDLTEVTVLDEACAQVIRRSVAEASPAVEVRLELPGQRESVSERADRP